MDQPNTTTAHDDQAYCWQQILRIRPHYRITRPYIASADADRLLVLNALFCALEETLSGTSEYRVAELKLAWWGQELVPDRVVHSQHPIARELHRCGAWKMISPQGIGELLRSSQLRLDPAAPADMGALKGLAASIGRVHLQLEMAVSQAAGSDTGMADADCRLYGLMQLLRESARSPRLGFWWIPMNLLARYSLVREDLMNQAHGPAVTALMKDILLDAVQGKLATGGASKTSKHGQQQAERLARNQRVQLAVFRRQVTELLGKHPRTYAGQLGQIRLMQVLLGWNAARKE